MQVLEDSTEEVQDIAGFWGVDEKGGKGAEPAMVVEASGEYVYSCNLSEGETTDPKELVLYPVRDHE